MTSVPGARVCALYLIWCLLATATTASAAPPEIVITEDAGPSVTLSIGSRAHYVLPKAVQIVELKCQADYPVMWKDIHSIVYPGVIGAESERIVDMAHFNQEETYKFSMTLKRQLSGRGSVGVMYFECLSAGQENSTLSTDLDNRSTMLTMKWDRTLQAFMCSLGATTTTAKAGSLPDMTVNLAPSRGYPAKMKVTCCLREGVHPLKDYRNLVLGYGDCPEPLLCIKKNTTLEGNFEWPPSTGDGRCASVYLSSKESGHIPEAFACGLKGEPTKDWSGFRMDDTGEFSWLDYVSVRDNSKPRQWTRATSNISNPVTFYTRDTVLLKCQASTIYYAKGIVWELEFKNGTSHFIRNDKIAINGTIIKVMHGLSFVHNTDVDSLVQLSCHIPPWNSTKWVTHSIHTVIEPSSAPTSSLGPRSSFAQENITFYTHESAQLQCDLTGGQPQSKFEWKTESSIYSSSISESKSSAIVSVSWQHWIKDPRIPRHPQESFSCSARNLAGNATKVFNVQAIQSFVPILANAAREAVVIYAGDRGALLNCSLTQGVPAPNFFWQRHGHTILPGDNDTFQINTTDSWSVLIFHIVRLEDEAEYTCNSTNVLGFVTKEFSVRIRERPVSPVSVPETSHWSGLTITLLIVALILFVALAFLWFRNHKKVARLQARVEFASFKMEPFESKVTLDTLTE